MNFSLRQDLFKSMRRFFDAFDLSSGSDTSAPAIAARKRVIDSSNAFLGPFLNLWLLLSVIVCVVSWYRVPHTWYVPVTILIAGSAARYAVYRGALLAARWIFILPLILMILSVPPFINGIRTPLLATIPSLIILVGWMMGRRLMAFIGLLFAVALIAMWYVESVGWWEPPSPMREPEVWLRAFLLDLVYCIVTVAALIGNYQSELRRRFSLESRLSSVLKFSDTVIQRSPLPMCVFGASGKCVEVNDAYIALFETSRDRVLGVEFENLPLSGTVKDYSEAQESGAPRQLEFKALTSLGAAVWLDLRFLPFKIDDQSNLLVQCIDLTERKRMTAELEALAFNDSLTGLANRRLFFDRLDRALGRTRRHRDWGAVFLIDLDRFKELNDAHGHEAGDKLLVEVADRLRSGVRSTDTVARLGGDEFVLLFEEIGDDAEKATSHALELSTMLRRRLSDPYDLEKSTFLVSASIGFALFDGAEGGDAASILRKADASMYAAKKRHGG